MYWLTWWFRMDMCGLYIPQAGQDRVSEVVTSLDYDHIEILVYFHE